MRGAPPLQASLVGSPRVLSSRGKTWFTSCPSPDRAAAPSPQGGVASLPSIATSTGPATTYESSTKYTRSPCSAENTSSAVPLVSTSSLHSSSCTMHPCSSTRESTVSTPEPRVWIL